MKCEFCESINLEFVSMNNRKKPKGQSRIDNPEKLTTLGTHDTRQRQTKLKTQLNKIYVGHHFTQANTNNVNKNEPSYKQLKLE